MTQKILHILSQRPSHTGSGTTLDAIVRQAAAAGYDQHVIVGVPVNDVSPTVGDLLGDRIHPLVFGRPPLDYSLPGMSDVMPYPSARFSELGEGQIAQYCETWREHVFRVIDVVKPDLIHSHHIWLLSALLKDVTPEIPVVTHCHGTGLRQLRLCPHLAKQVVEGCRRNDHFLALHQMQAEETVQVLDVPSSRVTVIGAGYREETFHAAGRIPNNKPTLVYAGKLSFAKGLPQLLDAVELLRKDIPDLQLHIAGSGTGEEAEFIIDRMSRLASSVIWHGQLTPPALAKLFRNVSVIVLPSFFEGLPLVLVEAIASGCRAVATDLPGTRQIALELPDAVDLVPAPALESVDRPVTTELPTFIANLTEALRIALEQGPMPTNAGRTAAYTWAEIFRRIEAVWRNLSAS